MSKKDPIYSLYVVKAICAFCVVGIHTAPGGIFHDFFRPLFDIAVPLFFTITGYFLGLSLNTAEVNRSQVILKYFKSISYTCLIVVGIYFIAGIFLQDPPLSLEKIKYNIYHLRRGAPATGLHLWYMFAIWGAVLCLLVSSIHRYIFHGLIFFSVGLGLWGVYHLPGLQISQNLEWFYAVFFQALPSVSIGYLFARYAVAKRLKKYNLFCVVFAVLGIFWIYYYPNERLSLLGIRILVISVFALALRYRSCGEGSILALIGKDYSQGIYYWHFPVVYLIASPEKHIVGWENELLLFGAIVLSLFLAWVVSKGQALCSVPVQFRI